MSVTLPKFKFDHCVLYGMNYLLNLRRSKVQLMSFTETRLAPNMKRRGSVGSSGQYYLGGLSSNPFGSWLFAGFFCSFFY